jgi:hypothetical protein
MHCCWPRELPLGLGGGGGTNEILYLEKGYTRTVHQLTSTAWGILAL